MESMRTSEWIQAGFATILALAAWVAPLSTKRRWAITFFGLFAVCAILLARATSLVLSESASTALRDWLPVALTLIPYYQAGQFFTGPNEKIQDQLIALDRRLLSFVPHLGPRWERVAHQIMEWAYMMCYAIIPLGLAVLYAAGLRREASTFWFLVLVPTYFCYSFTPFVPALPPRSLGKQPAAAKPIRLRVFNLWLLKYGSIQAISFPSAHVAASLAVSLVLLRTVPIAGVIFLFVTFWIAVAAVGGGYHYASDVLLGAATTLLVFAAWDAHLIPSTLITALAVALTAPF
jgi:membrane-associated phospholipid phosphatase